MSVGVSYANEADSVTLRDLFASVVAPLEIYNDAARSTELAKYTAEHFRLLMRADRLSVVIAYLNGRPSGFAITEDEHGPIWIEWYGVAEEARGHGIGEQLIRFVLTEARRRNATRVWCDTRTDNLASNALFQKLGFRKLCELPNHWHGQDFFLWEFSPLHLAEAVGS